MINAVNYRYVLAILHIDRLNILRKETLHILEKIETKN